MPYTVRPPARLGKVPTAISFIGLAMVPLGFLWAALLFYRSETSSWNEALGRLLEPLLLGLGLGAIGIIDIWWPVRGARLVFCVAAVAAGAAAVGGWIGQQTSLWRDAANSAMSWGVGTVLLWVLVLKKRFAAEAAARESTPN